MKKIITFVILTALALSLFACSDKNNAKQQITFQEVYDAGKNMNALLGDHENVYIVATTNGKVVREEYLSKEYCYTFYDEEYMDIGTDNVTFATDHSEYVYMDNIYTRYVTLTQNGIVDMKEYFSLVGEMDFISSEIIDNDTATISEKNGSIIATVTFDEKDVEEIGDNIASCVETYTLDAKTREMTTIKTVYTYKDGTTEEGIVTIARDVEIPEGMKEFVKFENETENLRTVTIVSNPGADNEKTETVKVAKGVQIALLADFAIEETFTMYADAACTQVIEEELDVNSDITVYIKWNEQNS